jgi:hypothetical protein
MPIVMPFRRPMMDDDDIKILSYCILQYIIIMITGWKSLNKGTIVFFLTKERIDFGKTYSLFMMLIIIYHLTIV